MQTQIIRILPCTALLMALSVQCGTQAHAADAPPEAASAVDAGRSDEAQMQADMQRYFAGERRGGIWLMSAGAPAMALGTGLILQGDPFTRGLGCSVLAFGAIELLGGVTFYLNSNRRVPRFGRQIKTDPAAFRKGELARIRGVNRDMRLLEAVEVTLILAGAAMTSIGALQKQDLLAGIGTGLMLQTAVLFIYDQFAARRALRYTESLTRFHIATTGGPGLAPRGALLTVLQRF